MSFINSLGQGFADLVGGITEFVRDVSLFGWLPDDIQAYLFVVIGILVVLGIKRAVAV